MWQTTPEDRISGSGSEACSTERKLASCRSGSGSFHGRGSSLSGTATVSSCPCPAACPEPCPCPPLEACIVSSSGSEPVPAPGSALEKAAGARGHAQTFVPSRRAGPSRVPRLPPREEMRERAGEASLDARPSGPSHRGDASRGRLRLFRTWGDSTALRRTGARCGRGCGGSAAGGQEAGQRVQLAIIHEEIRF